jgi:chromate transport protein ChrA
MRLFFIWLGLGSQSFGGVATFALITRTAVERYGWITDEEFTH